MLQCSPTRDTCVHARGLDVNIRALSCVISRPRSQPRADGPKIKFSTTVLHTFQYTSPVQCIDWNPDKTQEQIACGHQDGSVTIQSLGTLPDPLRIMAKQQRSCTSVKFGESNMLAIGLDKVRNDTSLNVYDLLSQKSVTAFANSECVSALTWIPQSPNTVLAALNYRSLRLFDIRTDPKENGSGLSLPTKAVYEITADALDPHSLASTYDNSIMLWDLRRFNSAALSLKASTGPRGSRVIQLRFRPDRRSHLAGLSDDGTLDLWCLTDTESQIDSYKVSTHDCRISGSKLVAFDFVNLPPPFTDTWNGVVLHGDTDKVGLRSIDTSRPSIGYTSMNDFIHLANGRLSYDCSPVRGIVRDGFELTALSKYELSSNAASEDEGSSSEEDATSPAQLYPLLSEGLAPSKEQEDTGRSSKMTVLESDQKYIYESANYDVSSTMYRRALLGYGMKAELNTRLILDEHHSLKSVWNWLAWTAQAESENKLRTAEYDFALEGCLNIWRGIGGNPTSGQEPYSEDFFDAVDIVNSKFPIDIFPESITQAPLRQLALTSIGWCLTEAEFNVFQDDLIASNQHDKAAFHSIAQSRDLHRAVEILELGGALKVESAISDFMAAKIDDEADRNWRKMCQEQNLDLESPYIRAIFAYLNANDWRDVIDEQGLTLRERIAISIRYIRDEDLTAILQDLCRTEITEGNLEGLLLTGINTDSLKLLQTYVDRTGDVQTAALVASFKVDLCDDPRVVHWISDYKHLLSTWGMHLARCRFDIERTHMRNGLATNGESLQRQVCMRCHHCNAIITSKHNTLDPKLHEPKQKPEDNHKMSQSEGKSTFCDSCRKPLPKCVVCLFPVNTDHMIHICLTCNHSMHREHADEWFAGHVQCPASNCDCCCRY